MVNNQKLLTDANNKTIKSRVHGYRTFIMHLLPANFADSKFTVCPGASPGCIKSCLNTAGRGRYNNVQQARLKKTLFYLQDRQEFMERLENEIRAKIKTANLKGYKVAFRLNGTSDLPVMALQMAEKFPSAIFYDYTKIKNPWLRLKPNYRVVFSRSENNWQDCLEALAHGVNVAVVFRDVEKAIREGYKGYKVIGGDEHDMRFVEQSGVIIALKAKGRAKRDNTGFVVQN